MKYKIEWMEKGVTSTGKEKITANISDITGKKFEDVTLWKSSWTNFDQLQPGMEVEGDYSEKQNGQYLNKTLFQGKTWSGNNSRPAGMGAKLMEKKTESIKQAQENKELGIKISSTLRMAVDIVLARNPQELSDVEVQEGIKYWRSWLWSEWDKEDKDFPPFN